MDMETARKAAALVNRMDDLHCELELIDSAIKNQHIRRTTVETELDKLAFQVRQVMPGTPAQGVAVVPQGTSVILTEALVPTDESIVEATGEQSVGGLVGPTEPKFEVIVPKFGDLLAIDMGGAAGLVEYVVTSVHHGTVCASAADGFCTVIRHIDFAVMCKEGRVRRIIRKD